MISYVLILCEYELLKAEASKLIDKNKNLGLKSQNFNKEIIYNFLKEVFKIQFFFLNNEHMYLILKFKKMVPKVLKIKTSSKSKILYSTPTIYSTLF